MIFFNNLNFTRLVVAFLLMGFITPRSAVSIQERTIISRFDNQVFSLPDEVNEMADGDTVEVDGKKMTKGELKNIAKIARECHQFHTALVNDLQILSLVDKDVTDPIIIVGAHSSSMDRKQGKYKFLLDQICGAKGNTFFAEKIYPHVFNDLKIQSSNSLGASINLYLSGGSLDTPKENDVRLEKLAKRYGVPIAANDHKFIMGAAMGDMRFVGKTYLYDGIVTAKRKGYYEVMGIPPILVQGGRAFDKYNLGDSVVILIRITGSRRWQFLSGAIGNVPTASLIKIVPH